MIDFWRRLFDTDFMPHFLCLRTPDVIWLHVVSDLLIAAAYLVIPLGLILLLRVRKDLEFHWMFVLFAGFILSCGATHVLAVVTLWTPFYRFEGVMKAATALLSVTTAGLLIRLIPFIAQLPTMAQWQHANAELEQQIEDLRKAEEKSALLLSIVAFSKDAILSTTVDGVITSWNNGARNMFGYAREEAVGRNISFMIPEERLAEGPLIAGKVQQGEFVESFETEHRHQQGDLIPVSLTASPLCDESGALFGSSRILRDISHQKESERQILLLNRKLQNAASAAEAASRAKSTFLSTMSHEIRTPMNVILGYAQLMRRDASLSGEAKANLAIIGRSGEHLLGLINDVLDMSKIEAGRTELHVANFHLGRLLTDLAAMFRMCAAAKMLEFELHLPDEHQCNVYLIADEGKVRQALMNLLGNAIKFTRAGKVVLQVTWASRGGQPWLSASVSDTGPGISLEGQAELFRPFRQNRETMKKEEGTGLGLAITREFARLMGGDVTLASSPGHGAVFTFEIPVASGERGVMDEQSPAPRVRGLKAGTGSPRVLIVDDQAENRDWLMKLLASIGFAVRGAENGRVALEVWKDWQPAVILMDLHMPVLDGIEATRIIRGDPLGQNTSIVVLTASAMDDDRRAAIAIGADTFLSKPCREEELVATLSALLHIEYDYEEPQSALPDSPGDLTSVSLAVLPATLLEDLHRATCDGNKVLLNRSITAVRQSAGDSCADALQRLADRYEYDALAGLFEGARTASDP